MFISNSKCYPKDTSIRELPMNKAAPSVRNDKWAGMECQAPMFANLTTMACGATRSLFNLCKLRPC